MARPPKLYDKATGDLICERISEGMSLRDVCKAKDVPSRTTVNKWLAENPEFAGQYARACDRRAEAIFEDMLEIADDGRNDWMEREGDGNEGWALNGEHVQRSRVRIDTRKWVLSRMNPKKYGDKIEHSGDMTHRVVSTTPLAADEWKDKFASED